MNDVTRFERTDCCFPTATGDDNAINDVIVEMWRCDENLLSLQVMCSPCEFFSKVFMTCALWPRQWMPPVSSRDLLLSVYVVQCPVRLDPTAPVFGVWILRPAQRKQMTLVTWGRVRTVSICVRWHDPVCCLRLAPCCHVTPLMRSQ